MKTSTTIEFGDFAWTELCEEAERQGVSVEEVVCHAVLLFLADSHSGRFARRIPTRTELARRPTGAERGD